MTKTTTIKQGRDIIGRFTVTGSKEDCVRQTRFQTFKSTIGRYTRDLIIVCSVVSAIVWSYVAGMHSNLIVEAYNEPVITKEIKAVTPPTAVMSRIADCESGERNKHGKGIAGTATHYRNGQVLIKPVLTGDYKGTYDIGYYQINSNHNATASKMGLDLTKEADNKAFAIYLYENKGTQPWYSSQSCWII